ncbi:MAG TPA: trypsin-like peptidase domain-containing protein [Abditibacteriaceae bacterium]|jgi:serine protease Do
MTFDSSPENQQPAANSPQSPTFPSSPQGENQQTTESPAIVSSDNWRAGLDAPSKTSPAETVPSVPVSTVEFDRTEPVAPAINTQRVEPPAQPLPPVAMPAPPMSSPAPHRFSSQPIGKADLPPAPPETVRTETVRVATLNPLAAMLGGGVLACACVALGALLGARGRESETSVPGTSGVNATSGGAIVSAVRSVGPSVMNVDTEFSRAGGSREFLPDPSMGTQPQRGKGTGVVIDTKRGLMLTNAHVVAGAKTIRVTTREGQEYPGKLLGSDRLTDIAVVVLSNKTLPQAKLAPIKDPRKDLAIGEWAIAIGNPFAQANTVTVGVVSAVGRAIPVPGGRDGQGFQLTDMIQTDAAINPGNSGGPLCNIRGEVIGINTAIIPFGTGLGFTIPINKAMSVADQLIKKGKVKHPFIGIRMLPISDGVQKDFGLPDKDGTFVQGVEPGSPAAKAGIKSGDVVRRVNGKAVKTADEVQRLVAGKKVGESLAFEILRNNSVKRTVKITIGDRPQ